MMLLAESRIYDFDFNPFVVLVFTIANHGKLREEVGAVKSSGCSSSIRRKLIERHLNTDCYSVFGL